MCKIVPNKDLDKTVVSFDEQVARETCDYLNSIRHYKTILPMKRYSVPTGFRPYAIIVSHDGAQHFHSATVHLVSKRIEENVVDEEEFYSAIIASKSAMSSASAFQNELKSFAIATELLKGIIGPLRMP